jgi:predicted transcriptional regulator
MGFNQILYWLIAGTRGGANRARILELLSKKPGNARNIAQALGLDYKTIQHHLELLTKNGVIVSSGPNYGKVYFLSQESEEMKDEIRKLSQQACG